MADRHSSTTGISKAGVPGGPLLKFAVIMLFLLDSRHAMFSQEREPQIAIGSAEDEFFKLDNRLEILTSQIEHLDKIYNNSNLYFSSQASSALKAGIEFTKDHMPDSAIAELNYFLEYSQNPARLQLLEAHYHLAKNYQQSNNDVYALQHFLAYIKLNHKNESPDPVKLEIALNAVNTILNYRNPFWNNEAEEVIRSLQTIDLGPGKGDLNFLLANTFLHHRPIAQARQWIKNKNGSYFGANSQPKLDFLEGLMASMEGDFKKARTIFSDSESTLASSNLQDVFYLALGRVNSHLNKPATAVDSYQKIGYDSNFAEIALQEQFIVAIDGDDPTLPATLAEKYLTKFPKGKYAAEIRGLLPFAYLLAGNVASARKLIQQNLDTLERLSRQIGKSEQYVTAADMAKITTIDFSLFSMPENLRQARELLVESQTNAMRIKRAQRTNVMGIIQLAQADQDSAMPSISQRLKAMENWLQHTLVLGQTLAFSSSERLKNQMSAAQKERVRLLAERIGLLLNKKANVDSTLLEKTRIDLAAGQLDVQMKKIHASWDSLRVAYNSLQFTADRDASLPQKMRFEALNNDLWQSSYETSLALLQPEVRNSTFLASAARGETVFNTYDEIYRIFAAVSINDSHAAQLSKKSVMQTWKKFLAVRDLYLANVDAIHKSADRSYDTLLDDSAKQTKQASHLESDLAKIKFEVLNVLFKKKHHYIDQLNKALNRSFALHKQWQGDLDWVEHDKKNANELALRMKHSIEQLRLNEQSARAKMGIQ